MKNKNIVNYVGLVMLVLFIIIYAVILLSGYDLQIQRWIKFIGISCYLTIMTICSLYSKK